MERMCDAAAADELEFEAVAATKTAAIKSCRRETTTATVAPTPSCSLPTPPTATAASEVEPTTTTLQIKEEIKDEDDDDEEVEMTAQMKLNEEDKMQGGVEKADEQSERYDEKEQTAATIKTPPPPATSMSDTTLKTSLPWDFIANDELCRSCGKPHTELYELFENEQKRRRHSTSQQSGNNSDDDDESNSRRIVKSNNGNSHSNNNDDGDGDGEAGDVSSIRRDPRAIARAAIATKTTAKQQQQQLQKRQRQQSEEQSQSHTQATQPSQMDNILQEMQIWHLRIKPNDGLPQRICPKCTAQFYIIGKFRRKCLKVQIRLRSMLREVEQQQQVFLATAAKDARDTRADTSPARQLDIGNELMNKQHYTTVVQPLSEVELFETNWNVASEATNSGMLIEGEEMLVDEPTINAAGANDDNKDDESDNDADGDDDEDEEDDADEDEDEEEEDVELTSAMCIDVTPNVVAAVKALDSRPGCLRSKTTMLATSKHSSSSGVDQESQQVSKDSYKSTSHMKRKRTRKLTTATAAEDAHTLTRSSFVADSTDNQDDYYDPLEEKAMSTSKVEIISIENLKNIEHFTNNTTTTNTTTTAPPPNYKAATPQRTKTTMTAASKQKSPELTSKSIKKPNKANPQKDCKTTTETQSVTKHQTTNAAAANNTEAFLLLHSRDVPTNNVKPHKTTTKTGRIEAESPTAPAALVAHSNSQNAAATRVADNLTPTTLLKLNEEGMKAFVSKAALKEYDSSPSTFAADDDDDCGGGDVNVDPQHAPLEQTQSKTADKNDSFDNEHKAMEDNPEEMLIIPYAQKRRKKCRRLMQSKSTEEMDIQEEEVEGELLVGLEELTSFSALDNHEITSVNTDTLPIRECSVRLYKLNDASKKSNLITTATATTTSNTPMTLMQDPQTSSAAATNEIMDNAFENVIDAAAPAEANQQALHHTKEQKPTVAAEAAAVDEDEDDDDENMPILKKIKLMKAARQEALQLKRRVSSHWKTKAEMKAVNEDPLSFRKPSLRRQMKLEKYALMSKQLFDTQRAAANIGNQMETGVNLIDAENDTDQVENAARKANVRFADEEEAIASEDLIDNIKVETLVEQPTMSLSLPSTTGSSTYTITKELSKECGGGGGGGQKTSPLKMVLRKSRYHEKLRLKRNLRANLLKLRQHNTAMATNLKCKQMQEAANAEGNHGGAGVSNAPAAAAVSITHIDLAAMVTDREAMQPPPVAKIDKLLATNFDLPTTNEALRESSMIVIPTDGDKSNAALEAATKITTTTKTEEATSGVETSLEQILSQRAAEPKLIVASNNKQGSVVLHASKTSAYGIGVNEHLQELPVSSAATSSTHANELELAFETFEQQPPPIHQSNQLKSEEQDELIVRVPLAVLTQDFQRMHFTHTDQNVEAGRGSATELPCRSSDTQAVTAVTTNWIAPENLQPQRSDYALATETQTAFASETIQLHHHHHQHQLPATAADDATADFANSKPSHETSAACSLNESDQSEFYGFGNDSDPRPTTAYDANDSFIPEKHSTMISSQINDYINEFQTHCLEADEKSPPHFSHDSELLNNDKNSTNLQTLQPTRGCSSHLANNGGLVVDNYVDNTLNGLLDEIQEQNLFSPSTTPLVTMESEDFHHHSSYSPLSSESSEQTPRSHQDYMKNSLCDLSPGPTVNPSHIIDATTQNSYTNAQLQQQQHQLQQQQQQQQQHQHQLLHQQQQLQQQQQHHQQQQQQQQQHSYNNYVECFTEDSTQSELIGFQNDIPCFENIELNSSTPRHNSTPPPPPPPQNAATAAVVQQVQLANTPTRTPNCSLQAAADQTPHPGANLKLPHKHIETGNVHYLGLGNETDLCQSLNTDSMGLVCTTGTGVQMHTPTLKSASGQMQEIPYERETISSESSDNSREYAVDSATLHFTQIFQDMPLHQQQQQPQEAQQGMSSTLQSCELRKETSNVLKTTSSPNVATSKKSAILAKYAASNNTSGVTRNLFSKKLEPATLQLPPTPKLQYVTLPPQPQHSTLSLSTQDPNNTTGLNTTQLLAAPHSTLHHHNQEMLNLGPTKYTLYTEVLPQDLQWHTTPNNMPDQQTTTTTYYINAADLNQSNLISTTTIAMQPLIHSHAAAGGAGTGGISLGSAGADLNTMTNLTLLPTQLSTGQPTATLMQSQSNSGGDKRSMDANENYMDNGGMQNQSIMIVFPQEYINDPTSGVSALYNTAAGNQLTLAPLQQTYSTIVPPPPPPPPPPQQQQQQQQQVQLNNATMMPTTLQSNATPPQTMLNNSATVPVQVSAAAATAAANRAATPTISAPHPSRHAAASSPLQPAKINLTCRFCHKRPKFTNNLDYSNHIIEMHPGENPFNCPHCPLLFTRRAQRQQHIVEVHGALRFNCAQCGQSFCAQRTLDLHLQRAHVHNDAAGQNKKAVQLQQQQQQQKVDVTASCSQAREGQTAHYEAAAATTKTTTTNWHERLHATTGNSATEQHASLEDVATTPFQAASATDEDDSENSSTADNSQLATESSTVQKPPHRILGCPDCDDSFDDLANQEPHTHQLLHSSHQQLHHTTPQTGNSSGSTSNLCTMPSPEQTEPDSTSTTTLRQFRKQRQSSKSPIEQPERVLRSAHSCVFCEERFTNEVALRKHHQTAHGNQTTLPFVCSMCKRGFRMRTALQRHMETHDSVGRPYECSICLVRFPRPSQLTLHKLTVHFLRKPHACNICGKQFGTESALKTHEKFHGAHIKTHIPLGMCIEEDPPSLQRDREQREQEQLQLAAAESADQLNDAAAFDDMPSPEIHQVQRSS